MQAAGAHYTTAADGVSFLRAVMGLRESGLQSAFATMTRPYSNTPTLHTYAGYGWLITAPSRTEQYHWHNGTTPGFACFLGYDSVHRRGVIVLSNTASSVENIGFHALAPQRYPLKPLPETVPIPQAIGAKLPGVYRLGPQMDIYIRGGGQVFTVELPGQAPVRLYPVGNNRLLMGNMPGAILVEFDSKRNITGIAVEEGGSLYRARKVSGDVPPLSTP